MKYRYAIIPYSGAVLLGVEDIRRQTATGEVIVNESDLLTYGEQTSSDADRTGGKAGITKKSISNE